MKTINKAQFKRLVETVSADAPSILKGRDKSDEAMDKKSALLRALLSALRERLELPDPAQLPETDFKTYEFALRAEIYKLAEAHAAEPFEYQPIINEFLSRAKG